MTSKSTAAAPKSQRTTLSTRNSTSRKAAEPNAAVSEPKVMPEVPPPEQMPGTAADQSPQEAADQPRPDQVVLPALADILAPITPEPESAPTDAPQPQQPVAPAPAPAWSSEDESAFQGMQARRKAAGYQRQGKDVGAQVLRVGDISPNPGTVVAAIVAVVAEHHTIGRGKLLDAMATAAFPNAKAKPTDRGWCQGYVAGAVRDGFLALADGADGEAVPQ